MEIENIVLVISIVLLIFVFFLYYRAALEVKKVEEESNRKIKEYEMSKRNLEEKIFERREDDQRKVQEEKEKIDFLIEQYRASKMNEIQTILEQEKQKRLEEVESDFNVKLYELEEAFEENKELRQTELNEIVATLEDFKLRRAAVNEAIRREKEILEKEDFYRIVLLEVDKEYIVNLKKVEPYIHNKEVLQKLIFDVYVRRPLNEMIKRVVGSQTICGVYKITYIPTGESYIGKSVDIGKRWQEHIKTSLGIGNIANSSLHTKIKQMGVDNFYFEIVEEVTREKLTEREKYWINFYGTITQLNMKVG